MVVGLALLGMLLWSSSLYLGTPDAVEVADSALSLYTSPMTLKMVTPFIQSAPSPLAGPQLWSRLACGSE